MMRTINAVGLVGVFLLLVGAAYYNGKTEAYKEATAKVDNAYQLVDRAKVTLDNLSERSKAVDDLNKELVARESKRKERLIEAGGPEAIVLIASWSKGTTGVLLNEKTRVRVNGKEVNPLGLMMDLSLFKVVSMRVVDGHVQQLELDDR